MKWRCRRRRRIAKVSSTEHGKMLVFYTVVVNQIFSAEKSDELLSSSKMYMQERQLPEKSLKEILGTQIFRENQSRFHLSSGRTWKTVGDISNLKHSSSWLMREEGRFH